MGFHNIPPAVVDAREIATGSYTGDATDNRQITVGFKCSMVIILHSTSNVIHAILIPSVACHIDDGTVLTGGTALHASDGFIVFHTTDDMNRSTDVYYYWAISE